MSDNTGSVSQGMPLFLRSDQPMTKTMRCCPRCDGEFKFFGYMYQPERSRFVVAYLCNKCRFQKSVVGPERRPAAALQSGLNAEASLQTERPLPSRLLHHDQA